MIAPKARASEIAAASHRNPALARVLEDIYARIENGAEEPAPEKKPRRRSSRKKSGEGE